MGDLFNTLTRSKMQRGKTHTHHSETDKRNKTSDLNAMLFE